MKKRYRMERKKKLFKFPFDISGDIEVIIRHPDYNDIGTMIILHRLII